MGVLLGYLFGMCWLSFVVYSFASQSNKDILHPYRDLDWDDDEDTTTETYVQDEYGFYHEVNNGYFVDSKVQFTRDYTG